MLIRISHLFFLALITTSSFANTTLQAVQERGYVRCGVGEQYLGFSQRTISGEFSGFDVDFCRTVAAAVFGDSSRVEYIIASNEHRFRNLEKGLYDVLYRTTTWTLTRDAAYELDFAGINYYDGQGFMAHRKLGANRLDEVGEAKICAIKNTTTYNNLTDYIKKHNKPWSIIPGHSKQSLKNLFFTGECDLYTNDRSGLASIRASDAPIPDDIILFPDVISKEPLGPVVRSDDQAWFDIVKWSLLATIEAEELGLTSKNIHQTGATKDPAIQHFIGKSNVLADALGLEPSWAYNIITQVGNYEEIFDRNLGTQSILKLERGINQLWSQGGLLYSPPFR